MMQTIVQLYVESAGSGRGGTLLELDNSKSRIVDSMELIIVEVNVTLHVAYWRSRLVGLRYRWYDIKQ